MVVFLVMQTCFFLDRVCGLWKLSQVPRMQKILWNNIRSFERHASMFWKYFDWSQLFFFEKVNIFLVFKQCFDWSQLFFCEKVRRFLVFYKFWLVTVVFLWQKVHIFLVLSKREKWTYCSVPYVPNVQSKCFQMFSFFEELEAPFQIWNPQSFWGVSCIPQPSAIISKIYYVWIVSAHMFLFWWGVKDWRIPIPLPSNYNLSNKRAKKFFL